MQLYSLVNAIFGGYQLKGFEASKKGKAQRTRVDLLSESLIGRADFVGHQLSHIAVDSICADKDVTLMLLAIFGGDDNAL